MYYLVYVVQIGGSSINGGKTLYGVKLATKTELQLPGSSPKQEILLEPFEFRELIPLFPLLQQITIYLFFAAKTNMTRLTLHKTRELYR